MTVERFFGISVPFVQLDAGICRRLLLPDGVWLFINIQTPGITFAITGPWGPGPL